MNMLRLAIASLRFRALNNSFNALVLALGVALIVMLLQVSGQLEKRFDNDLNGIDLVVGAKGSPLQLILSSVFHLDTPTGNIPLAEADKLKANPMVKSAIPLALGDSFHGFRIVGTTPDYADHYHAELKQGVYWDKPMQAVFGSEAARATHVKMGDSFVGSHGLTEGGEEHAASPYEVVGILAPTGTVLDRLVLTDVGSVWEVHAHHHEDEHEEAEHHEEASHDKDKKHDEHEVAPKVAPKELTALLITYRTPLAAAALPRLINTTTSLQAASPALEMGRLRNMLGTGGEIAELFAYALMAIAGTGAFISLLAAVNERQYDMALLRTLGMTRRRLFAFVILQGVLIGTAGALVGLLLGHDFSGMVIRWIRESKHISITSAGFQAYEIGIALAAVALSACAALIPAVMAYRMNPASVLSRRS